jgi:hypothetical protein
LESYNGYHHAIQEAKEQLSTQMRTQDQQIRDQSSAANQEVRKMVATAQSARDADLAVIERALQAQHSNVEASDEQLLTVIKTLKELEKRVRIRFSHYLRAEPNICPGSRSCHLVTQRLQAAGERVG